MILFPVTGERVKVLKIIILQPFSWVLPMLITLFLSCSTEGPNYQQLIPAGEHINTEQKHWSGNIIRLKHREDIVNTEQS